MRKDFRYAVVTPSFWKDFERCKLLVRSFEKWVAPHVIHYLVIDRDDISLFKALESERTRLLVVEDIIPKWLFRFPRSRYLPGLRRFWFSLRTRPVKNWILQQIVKLSVPSIVEEDVLLYADSDTFFCAPYDPRSFERDGLVPLFAETGQQGLIPQNDRWEIVATKLLGIPSDPDFDINYVGNIICWRRANVLAMLNHIEQYQGRAWQTCIAPLRGFSEYILYGVYVTRVLGAASGHWNDGETRTLNYWLEEPLNEISLAKYATKRKPIHHSMMISAKSRTEIALYRHLAGIDL